MSGRAKARRPGASPPGPAAPPLGGTAAEAPPSVTLRLVVLVVLTVLAYVPVARGGFIWDDDLHVTNNTLLRTLDGLAAIWFRPGAIPQYYPLTHTSFWVEFHLWGLEASGYHLVNIVLHGLNAAVLYLVLEHLAVPLPWVTAAVFALHPVQVESVAWISELKNVQSGFLYLLAALAYVHAALPRRQSPTSAIHRVLLFSASLLAFACAVLSKTVTCTLPAALLLLLWWKRGRVPARSLLETLPFWLLGLAAGLSTVWMEQHYVGATGEEWTFSPLDRCLIAGRALWFYAAKLVWPLDLVFSYPRWKIDAELWWQWLPALTAVGIVALLVLRRHRIGRGPLAAVLYFIATLSPALGFVNVYPMRYTLVADHFQYLASIGLMSLCVVLGKLALDGAGVTSTRLRRGVASGLAAILFVLTWQRAGVFASAEVLWRDTLAKNPSSWMAHDNFALLLLSENRLVEAEAEFREELRLEPPGRQVVLTLSNIGIIRARQGKLAEAGDYFTRALALDETFAQAHNNLGNILVMQGRVDEGIRHYQRALEINPAYVDARNNLAAVRSPQTSPGRP